MLPPVLQNGVPYLTTSQRRKQLEEGRFLDTRNLAYITYKKPDQTPLMTYEETLDNREAVFRNVLAFEVSQGWLIPDGTENQSASVAPAAASAVQPQQDVQGAPQMTTQFQPPPAGIPNQQFTPPAGAPVAAQPPAQPGFPQQAAQPAGVPPQQEQPVESPTGKKRGRPPGSRNAGAAVAPPPPAPPLATPTTPMNIAPQSFGPGGVPVHQPQQQFQPQPTGAPQFQPTQQFQPQQPAPQFQPPAPQQVTPPTPPQFQTQAFPAPGAANGASGGGTHAAPAVDLSPVIQRQDATAKMVETLGNNLTAELAAAKKELAETKSLVLALTAAVHHLYMVNQALQPQPGQPPLPQTLPDFIKHLHRYVGSPS